MIHRICSDYTHTRNVRCLPARVNRIGKLYKKITYYPLRQPPTAHDRCWRKINLSHPTYFKHEENKPKVSQYCNDTFEKLFQYTKLSETLDVRRPKHTSASKHLIHHHRGLRNPPAHHSPKERSRQILHGVTCENCLHRQVGMDQQLKSPWTKI